MICPDLKLYPYDQPPSPRKRCPLARGFANATRSLRGLLSVLRGVLYAGLPARNRGLPRAPLRVDRRPGQPPAVTLWSVPRYGGAIARGAPKSALLSLTPRLRYGSGFIEPRDPSAPPRSTSS